MNPDPIQLPETAGDPPARKRGCMPIVVILILFLILFLK